MELFYKKQYFKSLQHFVAIHQKFIHAAVCVMTSVQVSCPRVGVLSFVWCSTVCIFHWVTVTCCIFLIEGNVFMPWGGYREPWMSEGERDPGTGRGLTDPGSLCTDPPLPSDWPSFFLISLRSLALRFWNQIFTWKQQRRHFILLQAKGHGWVIKKKKKKEKN